MSEIREYRVEYAINGQRLAQSVERLMQEGWTLQGGVACDPYGNYAQALYRERQGEKP